MFCTRLRRTSSTCIVPALRRRARERRREGLSRRPCPAARAREVRRRDRKRRGAVGRRPRPSRPRRSGSNLWDTPRSSGSVHYTKGFWGGVKTEFAILVAGDRLPGSSDVPRGRARRSPTVGDYRGGGLAGARFPGCQVFALRDARRRLASSRLRQGDGGGAARRRVRCAFARTRFVLPVPSAAIPRTTTATCIRACGAAVRHQGGRARWRGEAYVNHVAKVKMSVPRERLLVVPMLADQSPVAVAQAVDPSWSSPPRRWSSRRRIHSSRTSADSGGNKGGGVVLFIAVGVLGSGQLFVQLAPAADSPGCLDDLCHGQVERTSARAARTRRGRSVCLHRRRDAA